MGEAGIVSLLVQIPRKHNALNVSVYSLLVETGYFEVYDEVTESEILKELRRNSEYISDWREFSDDKRTTGWYLMEPSNGCYRIGYIPVDGDDPIEPLEYKDEASACAAFIKLELEDVRTTALKSEVRRGHPSGK
jgi:hypothetical protein